MLPKGCSEKVNKLPRDLLKWARILPEENLWNTQRMLENILRMLRDFKENSQKVHTGYYLVTSRKKLEKCTEIFGGNGPNQGKGFWINQMSNCLNGQIMISDRWKLLSIHKFWLPYHNINFLFFSVSPFWIFAWTGVTDRRHIMPRVSVGRHFITQAIIS